MYKPLIGWGINVPAQEIKKSNVHELIERIIKLRFEWIRFEFDFRGIIDQATEVVFIDRCHQAGIKVLGLLNCSVPGSLINLIFPEFKQRSIMETKKAFIDFVERKLDRHGNIIKHWEVYNEPNLKRFWIRYPNPRDYSDFLKDVAKVIRKRQNQAKVVFGGLMGSDESSIGPFKMSKFFQKCAQYGSVKHFDISNFHPYSFDSYVSSKSCARLKGEFVRKMEKVYTYAKSVTNKPVWFSEFGIASKWVRISQTDIAMVYWHCYQWCRQRRIPLFIWSLQEMNKPLVEFFSPENSFGLLDKQLKPKRTYLALQELVERQI